MGKSGKPRQVGKAMKRGIKALWGGFVSLFFVLLILVLGGKYFILLNRGRPRRGG